MNRPGAAAIPLVLCADDYAIAPGVGRAIRALIGAGRLSATGCMTTTAHWPEEGARLRPFAARADIGLHLALTDGAPAGPMPRLAPAGRLPTLPRLIWLDARRGLDGAEIAAEIDRQCARFEAVMGAAPAFIDGHQHVHQLRAVRAALATVIDRRYRARPPWIRVCDEAFGAILARGVAVPRAAAVSLLGGRALRRMVDARGWCANDGFAGVRDFAGGRPYRTLFGRFLRGVRPWGLIMCHPGEPDAELAAVDRVTTPRGEEFAYLAGHEFPADLAAAGVALARLSAADAR